MRIKQSESINCKNNVICKLSCIFSSDTHSLEFIPLNHLLKFLQGASVQKILRFSEIHGIGQISPSLHLRKSSYFFLIKILSGSMRLVTKNCLISCQPEYLEPGLPAVSICFFYLFYTFQYFQPSMCCGGQHGVPAHQDCECHHPELFISWLLSAYQN